MMMAAVFAIRDLAKQSVPDVVLKAYNMTQNVSFGPEYILPKPMDPRLLPVVSAAVAKAAVETGVARIPYPAHYPLPPIAPMSVVTNLEQNLEVV
jgi:malate dehydrogenase (oxaloacetate-decarboxylating)(NADP+)